MKPLILASLLFVLTGVSYAKISPVESARELTVLVTNNAMTGTGAGTGIILDNTHVLTCFHMASGPKDDFLVYTYPLNRVIRAHIEGGNQGDDILILTLESSVTVKATPVFQEKYEVGEPITVIGNALGGMQWFVTRGIISGESQGYLLTDALINPGNSGGPWVNEKGEIVALTDWGIGPEPHIHGLSGGVSAASINRMLDAWARSRDMAVLRKVLQGKI